MLRNLAASTSLRAAARVAGVRSVARVPFADMTVTPAETDGLQQEDGLTFGTQFTERMLECDFKDGKWEAPAIKPFADLTLHPAAAVLHYGNGCFEGMKAYRTPDGRTVMFRPDMNAKRMVSSMARLALPAMHEDDILAAVKKVVTEEKAWVPEKEGNSLYIRPTAIATVQSLGVSEPDHAKFFTILSPVGPYFPTGFKAVSLLADPTKVRACVGGVGSYKVAGNYAPTIKTQVEAAAQNYQQVLWLSNEIGKDVVTEAGTMNVFIVLENKEGETEIVTPPLCSGLILPGVTRDSIILMSDHVEWMPKITERNIDMAEIVEAAREGRVKEMFGAGTACVVSPIKNIGYQGEDIAIPLDPTNPDSQAGPLTAKIHDELTGIQRGEITRDYSADWLVEC